MPIFYILNFLFVVAKGEITFLNKWDMFFEWKHKDFILNPFFFISSMFIKKRDGCSKSETPGEIAPPNF